MGTDEAGRGRLLWRCRRGMKELDLVLRGWLDACWSAASAAERAAFEQILELPDPVLAGYLLGRETPTDPALAQLVATLRGRAGGAVGGAGAAAGAREPQP